MKPEWVQKMPFVRGDGGSHFPFKFCRQPLLRPAGKSVGLKIIHMAERFIHLLGLEASQRVVVPDPIQALPIYRRGGLLFVYPGPAFRKPELGTLITLILDECQKLTIGRRAVCNTEAIDVGKVTGHFVIKAEALVTTDSKLAGWEVLPLHTHRFCRCRIFSAKGFNNSGI